jgi:hypothetical protein
MVQTMLMDSKLTNVVWAYAVYTIGHIQNKVILINNTDKNPYELWKGIPTNVKYFIVFGSKFYIKREYGRMRKFDSRVEKGIIFRYLSTRKAYKCFNIRLKKIVERINVIVNKITG